MNKLDFSKKLFAPQHNEDGLTTGSAVEIILFASQALAAQLAGDYEHGLSNEKFIDRFAFYGQSPYMDLCRLLEEAEGNASKHEQTDPDFWTMTMKEFISLLCTRHLV